MCADRGAPIAVLTRTGDYTWTLTGDDGSFIAALGSGAERVLDCASDLLPFRRRRGRGGRWFPAGDEVFEFRAVQGSSSRQRSGSALRVWR